MQQKRERINQIIKDHPSKHHFPIIMDPIIVKEGAIKQLSPHLKSQNKDKVVIIADKNTHVAAAQHIVEQLEAESIHVYLHIIQPDMQGDVIADESTLIKLMSEIDHEKSHALIAVGAGTIHDIVRFVAFKMKKPFISVPTAPSVDGFTSKGAPIIIKGKKITFPAIAPDAIFADLQILNKAPQAMIAAGFGDMLAKYTSLFDWKFEHLVSGQTFDQATALITENALLECVNHVQEIATRKVQGIQILMESLIESGLAMLLFGRSHPASGAEHHLSHYWEMEYIKKGKKQLLHGSKVEVACIEISRLYHRAIEDDALFHTQFLSNITTEKAQLLHSKKREIIHLISQIPEANQLIQWIKIVGGPTSIEELGIDEELFNRSMREAHYMRERYTLLKALNEGGLMNK